MLLLRYLRKLVDRHFKQMNWQAIVIMVLLYILASWLLLSAASEDALTGSDFFYWLLVTASTVGLMLRKIFVEAKNGRYKSVDSP